MPQRSISLKVTSGSNFFFDAGHSLEDLDVEVDRMQQNAFAMGTRINLNSQTKAFQEFCLRYNLPPIPATGLTLSRYATWLAVSQRAKTGQTVRNYLSAVRTFHKLNGSTCPSPTSDGPLARPWPDCQRFGEEVGTAASADVSNYKADLTQTDLACRTGFEH